MVYRQWFEPKKNWVFGLDLDGKPKIKKKSQIKKKKTESKTQTQKSMKFKILTQIKNSEKSGFWSIKIRIAHICLFLN
jgi:hypothetical protein